MGQETTTKVADLAQSDLIQQQTLKIITSLKDDLLKAFPRLAAKHEVEPEEIQLALRFADKESGEGEMYYQIFKKWQPLKNAAGEAIRAHFGMDICGEDSLLPPPEVMQKEALVGMYFLGVQMAHHVSEPGQFSKWAEKYSVTKWSNIQGIFYMKAGLLWFAVFVTDPETGKSTMREKIDLFEIFEQFAKPASVEGEEFVVDQEEKEVKQVEAAATAIETTETETTTVTATSAAPDGFAH